MFDGFSSKLTVFFIGFILLYAVVKKTDILSAFVEGAREGFNSVLSVLFPLTLIITAVSVSRSSGLLDLISFAVSPITDFFGVPQETVPLMVIRPFSGSGAIAYLEYIMKQYGADSRIAEFSAVICASSETFFYTVGVYLNGLSDKCGKIILCSVFGYICAVVLSCIIV